MTDGYSLRVNGTDHVVAGADIAASLLSVLRDRLGLLATKDGCGTGQCGACTVLIDDGPHCACLVLAAAAPGREIVTLEGLDGDPRAVAVREAFVAEGAVQCGFCTPGLVVSVVALLARVPDPGDADIRGALAGHLCRCTGYGRVLAAVRRAAAARAGDPG